MVDWSSDPGTMFPSQNLDNPNSSQLSQGEIYDYRNNEQIQADQLSKQTAQGADDKLKDFNQHTNRITSKKMGKDCAQCQPGYQNMTIDKLTEGPETGYGTEVKTGFSKIVGYSQTTTTEIEAKEVSGDYYYLDKNQDWIYVHANGAFKGTKVKAEVKGGPSVDAGLFSGDAQAPMKSALPTTANAGLLHP